MSKAGLVSLEAVYIYIYIYIYISRLLEKENKEIKRINIDNKITMKPKNVKI